jgi:hypothetical protein
MCAKTTRKKEEKPNIYIFGAVKEDNSLNSTGKFAEKLASHIRTSLALNRKTSALITVLVLLLFGYAMIGLSQYPVFEKTEDSVSVIATSANNLIPISVSEIGTYYINSTSGRVYFGDEARLRIYDSRESLVFSHLISSFPSYFTLDFSGYYTVVLENISLELGGFVVCRSAENYTISYPIVFLDLPGKVIFILGVAGFVVAMSVYYVTQRNQDPKKIAELGKFFAIPKGVKALYAFLACLACSMGIVTFINAEFVQLSLFGVLIICLILVPLILIYWFRIEEVYAFSLLEDGYRDFLSIEKWVKVVAVFSIFTFVLISLPAWVSDIKLKMSITSLSTWLVFPSLMAVSLLVPFIGSLTPEGEAFLALKEFSSDYRHRRENVDSRYIKKASRCIASLLANSYPILSERLSEYIATQQLSPADVKQVQGKSVTIADLQKCLHPFNLKKLYNHIQAIPDIRDRDSKRHSNELLQRLYYFVIIVVNLITVIKLILRL